MRLPPIILILTSCLAAPACRSNQNNTDSLAVAHAPPSGLVFTGRRPDGCEIALSDRTKWAIQPAGASATLHWQPGEPLKMGSSGEPMWPAAITSVTSGNTAFARPAGRF